MSLRAPVLLLSISAVLAMGAAPLAPSAQRYFKYLTDSVHSLKESDIGMYILDDLSINVGSGTGKATKESLIKVLVSDKFGKELNALVTEASQNGDIISGYVILSSSSQKQLLSYKLKLDSQNDAGFSLMELTAPMCFSTLF